MATASVPNIFVNGSNADANEVNANFSSIVNWLNTNAIQPDLANFSIFPTLPTSNPTNAYHAAHKNYVDLWLPAGSIIQYGGITAPAGWVLCDGTAYDGANPIYSRLYGAIGLNYGGSGVNAFQVPDLKGRVPIGVGLGSGLTNRNLNDKGGSETHKLTSAESGIPAHGHGITDPKHTHTIPSRPIDGGGSGWYTAAGQTTQAVQSTGMSSESTGITVNPNTAADASQAHNNMQPFIVVNFIIKL